MSAQILQFPDRIGVADRVDPARTEPAWAARAHGVLDCVETFLLHDGRAAEVVRLCERGTWCLVEAAADIGDAPTVLSLVERLADLHLRACRAAPPDPVALADFLVGVARCDVFGVRRGVIDPYIVLLGPSGLAELRRQLRAGQPGTGRARHPSAAG